MHEVGNGLGIEAPPTAVQSLGIECREDPDPPAPEWNWNGWGVDTSNTRFQAPMAAGLTAAQVPSLRLKWAFGFPGAYATYGQPNAWDGRIFEGSENGTVYYLSIEGAFLTADNPKVHDFLRSFKLLKK